MIIASVCCRRWFVVLILGLSSATLPLRADDQRTVAELTRDLQADDASGRAAAAEGLGQLGEAAGEAVPALCQVIEDDDPNVRVAAAVALDLIGSTEPSVANGLLGRLQDEGVDDLGRVVWKTAALALARLRPDVAAELTARLDSPLRHERRGAAFALSGQGERGRAAVPRLVQMMRQPDLPLRYAAFQGLYGIGAACQDAAPALIEMLADEDFHTQYWACRVLGKIGAPEALPAIGPMIELVGEGVPSVRKNAAAALGQIGPAAGEAAVSGLAPAVRDGNASVRLAAVQALGRLGPFARAASADLQAALSDTDAATRVAAAVALWQVTGNAQATVPVLLEEISQYDVPWSAATGFATLGGAAQDAVPRLSEMLKAAPGEQQLFAIQALAGIGPAAKEAVPDLEALTTGNDDPELQEMVRAALRRIQGNNEAGDE
jgi:HEAT repeat protein